MDESPQRETGGILLGFRDDEDIQVEAALTVKDSWATRSSYRRRQKKTQRQLDEYLEHCQDQTIGYVGEWHTHTAPQPPSETDRATMARFSAASSDAIALVVVARDEPNAAVWYGLLIVPGGQPVTCPVELED